MNSLTLLIKPVSGACQYHCTYCFYRDEMARRSEILGKMELKTLENLVKKAFAAAETQVMFAFQGGEPMMAGIDFYEALIGLQRRYSHGKVYANSLQTNGGLLNEKWAAFLKREHFLVGLSLDGDRLSHDQYRTDQNGMGTWKQTRDAAETLGAFEVPFNVLCVVSKANVQRPKQIYETLRPYKFIQFIPCLEALDAEKSVFSPSCDEYARFLNDTFELYREDYLKGQYTSIRLFDNYIQMLMGLKPESCSMNGRCSVSLTIESDGKVYPCDFYCLDEWCLGSLEDKGFIEMVSSKTAKDFVNSSISVNPRCKTCKYFSLCRGGCRREREADPFSSAHSINRYCEAYRFFFEKNYSSLLELKDVTIKRLKEY